MMLALTYGTLVVIVALARGLAGLRAFVFLAVLAQGLWFVLVRGIVRLGAMGGSLTLPFGEELARTSRFGLALAVVASWHLLALQALAAVRRRRNGAAACPDPATALLGAWLLLLGLFDAAALWYLMRPGGAGDGQLRLDILAAVMLSAGALGALVAVLLGLRLAALAAGEFSPKRAAGQN